MITVRILYSSDTHVHPAHLDRLLKAGASLHPEAIIVGGDLIPTWKGSIAASIEPHRTWVREKMLPRLRRFREEASHIRVLLDLGNDDVAAARPLLEENAGGDFDLLHMKIVRLTREVAVAGYMKVNPTPFLIKDGEKPDCRDMDGLSAAGIRSAGSVTTSGRETPHILDPTAGTMEDDLDDLARSMKGAEWNGCSFLFVSHAPPRNTALDTISSGAHVGSLAVGRFIERWARDGRLIATLHGHIHESPWVSGSVRHDLDNVPCFNIGQKSLALRALLLDTEDAAGSARLITVGPTGEVLIHEKDDWL
jgi:Icc-related predicted phosphoesterase